MLELRQTRRITRCQRHRGDWDSGTLAEGGERGWLDCCHVRGLGDSWGNYVYRLTRGRFGLKTQLQLTSKIIIIIIIIIIVVIVVTVVVAVVVAVVVLSSPLLRVPKCAKSLKSFILFLAFLFWFLFWRESQPLSKDYHFPFLCTGPDWVELRNLDLDSANELYIVISSCWDLQTISRFSLSLSLSLYMYLSSSWWIWQCAICVDFLWPSIWSWVGIEADVSVSESQSESQSESESEWSRGSPLSFSLSLSLLLSIPLSYSLSPHLSGSASLDVLISKCR